MKTKLVEVEYSIVTDDNKNHFLHSSGIKKLKILKIK